MKKNILFASLAMILLWSCTVKVKDFDKANAGSADSIKTISTVEASKLIYDQQLQIRQFPPTMKILMKFSYHGISFNTFKYLSTEFRTNFKNEAENVAFGGLLPMNSIPPPPSNTTDTNGLQYFLCCKTDASGKVAKLYIAYRTIDKFQRSISDFSINPNYSYNKSITPFYYTDQKPPQNITWNEEEKDSSFFRQPGDEHTDVDTTVSGLIVEADNNTFLSQYDKFLPSKKAYGFFLASELDEFRKLDTDLLKVKGIRFAFGYDYSADESKIKIMLFAVDKNGINMLIKTEPLPGQPNIPITHYPMIERAWPPSAD